MRYAKDGPGFFALRPPFSKDKEQFDDIFAKPDQRIAVG
jgi:hypothetical protein